MNVNSDFRDACEDVSLNIARALGLANALYFVMQHSEALSRDDDIARAVTSLAAMLEDTIRAAHERHEISCRLAGGK